MLAAPQVFYDEFGALMMRQPLFGLGFTTYAPIALLPYMARLRARPHAWCSSHAVLPTDSCGGA